jgi:4-amino-4-deoxy-L-arabinose transferase-like glycosyltransferase
LKPPARHKQEKNMSPERIFQIHLALGYVPWLFFLTLYVLPRIRGADPAEAQRAIAVLHSFRFFGLVFLVPGVVGANLPPTFATFAAYGDFATGILAMLALFTFRMRPVFWFFTVAFNVMGAADILTDYYHGTQVGLPELAGQLGAAYAIPILFVPLLMITHGLAFNLMARAGAAAAALQPRRA